MREQGDKKWVEGEWKQIEQDASYHSDKKANGNEHSIVLKREHQRFYDKLRQKVEVFLQKQVGGGLDRYILLAPDLFVLLSRLMQDKRVSAKSKAIAGLAVAYFISPLDFLPEIFAGPVGFLDDIVLSAYAISKIMNDVEPSVLAEHWSGEVDLLSTVQDLLKKAEELLDQKVLGKLKKLINK